MSFHIKIRKSWINISRPFAKQVCQNRYHKISQPFLHRSNMCYLQHIGKIDGVEKVGISYYDICTFGVFDVFSIKT
jgi:hypothetical protein